MPDGKCNIDGFLCVFDVSIVPNRTLEKQVNIIVIITLDKQSTLSQSSSDKLLEKSESATQLLEIESDIKPNSLKSESAT